MPVRRLEAQVSKTGEDAKVSGEDRALPTCVACPEPGRNLGIMYYARLAAL
jgi:hypothetical protein